MKHTKTIFKILIIFLLVSENGFARNPIPGIGIVVKKNNCLPNPCKSTCNHGGAITLTTSTSGGFSMQLEVGEYELSFPQDQLQSVIGRLIKRNYPKSTFQYDGSGVKMTLDNSDIQVKSKSTRANSYTINEQNSSFVITVPKEGAIFSGVLSWNDDVLKNSISCPDGFIMKNGECVPLINSENQQARTEGKTKGKVIKAGNNGMISVSGENSETPTTKKGWDGTIKGKKIDSDSDVSQRKGITEKGLKKNDADTDTAISQKKGLNAVNVKLSKETNTEAPNTIDDSNKESQDHAVKTKGSGATSGPEVKPIKVEETKIGQPHP
jgi:hypothetical protein